MIDQHQLFNYLLNWNRYFQLLSGKNQSKFVHRCFRFMRSTNFTSSDEIQLSNEMRILTASAFVQLTFGLKKYRLNWFKCINIVHKPYHYENSELLFHGDTNPFTKQINMVWPVILKGFETHNDALNLSIHELAHGLVMENSKASFFSPYFSSRNWRKWKVLASNEIQNLKGGKNSFFRAYGSKNLMEFFAVSTEAFFEQSNAFGKNYPKLYKAHCRLLNQDPRYSNAPKLRHRMI